MLIYLIVIPRWSHLGQQIEENSKYHIFPNGSLAVHRMDDGDEGDYACHVANAHAADSIVYEIIVQSEWGFAHTVDGN